MYGRERAVVAGIHRLKHVECFGATYFTDDDALGAHAQAVAYEIARGDLPPALDIRWARFQSHDVRLLTATDSIDPATGKVVPPERYDAAILMPWPMVAQLHAQLGRVLAEARGETTPTPAEG